MSLRKNVDKRNATFAKVFKAQYRAVNDRDGSEVYSGSSEVDASEAARKAAEDNAQRQALAPAHGTVWKDGKRVFYYECDPTMGRMKARKIFLTL